ncbi:MAG: hypothetical protein GY909_13245 [Oligoflexia bacterium]|nr:hypothetical protein [Oligoflexia bacterium]
MIFKKVLLLFLFLLISQGLLAEELNDPLRCEVNSAPNGTRFNEKNTKDYFKQFNYLPLAGKGKQVSLKDVNAKIWVKNNVVHLQLVHTQTSPQQKATASYVIGTKRMFLRMNGFIDFSCEALTKKVRDKEKEIAKKYENRGSNIEITIGKGIVFPLDQKEEQEGMRVVYFQKGKQYFSYNYLNQKIPWCAFRIKTLVRKTVVFYPKDKFKPTTFLIEKNDKNFDNYTYGFLDKDGNLTGGTSSYYPFGFNCKYFSGLEMTENKFLEIVGREISLK